MSGNSDIWIDSHAHLSMFDRAELDEVMDRAGQAGVAGVLAPATGVDDLDPTLALPELLPGRVVVAVGVHPHEAASLDGGSKRLIENAVGRPGVVAIGEIGLDYHYMNSPREDQLKAFGWQLDLATEAGLPVVIHNRESWHDLEPVLADRKGRVRGVCHSFAEPPEAARRVVELGLVVGLSGMVTFKLADNVRDMARVLEPDQVMVETDSPYLAPVPHRGQRNEPAFVTHVGDRLARELEVGEDELRRGTTETFRKLFGLDDSWPHSR
jgi:TatD DNase family protein